VMNNGFIKDGFPNVKMSAAETNIARKYMDSSADWFEPAVAYIDVAPEKPAVAMASAAPASTDAAAAAKPQSGGRGRGGRGARGANTNNTGANQNDST